MEIDGELDLKRATEALLRWLLSQELDVEDCVTLLQYTTFEIMRAHPDGDFGKATEFYVRAALARR